MSRTNASPIRFAATPYAIGDRTVLRLPEPATKSLPSRGQVAVHGTVNGHEFQTVIEPDGVFGHWINIDPELEQAARLSVGTSIELEVVPTKDWPEPTVPRDFGRALRAASSEVRELWKTITPMARWEWVRWVNETRNPDTRSRRIEVSISKLEKGSRRPCCFNLSACTDPELSKSGKLIEP